MSTLHVLSYASDHDVISQFEQAVRHSELRYSMRHLTLAGVTTRSTWPLRWSGACGYAAMRASMWRTTSGRYSCGMSSRAVSAWTG